MVVAKPQTICNTKFEHTIFFMEDEMIDLYEIAESNDDWIHSIEGVEEVFDPETQKLLAQF